MDDSQGDGTSGITRTTVGWKAYKALFFEETFLMCHQITSSLYSYIPQLCQLVAFFKKWRPNAFSTSGTQRIGLSTGLYECTSGMYVFLWSNVTYPALRLC